MFSAGKLDLLILLALLVVPGRAFSLSELNIKMNDGFAAEANQETASFTVTRTDDGNLIQLSIPLGFSGAAGHGPDYTLGNVNCCYTVIIPAGVLSTIVTLTPVLDNNVEGTETAIITLGANSDYELGDNIEAVIDITDDVVVVTVKVEDNEASEAGQGTGSFTVIRSDSGKVDAAIGVPLSFGGAQECYPLSSHSHRCSITMSKVPKLRSSLWVPIQTMNWVTLAWYLVQKHSETRSHPCTISVQ